MNDIVKIRLKKPYMNIPKDSTVRLPRNKAEILVKRKTGKIEGEDITYTQQEIDGLRADDKKEINRLGLVLDEFDLEIKNRTQAETDIKKVLKEERRKVAYFENRLKRYQNIPEPSTEKKVVGRPPKDKMLKGENSITK